MLWDIEQRLGSARCVDPRAKIMLGDAQPLRRPWQTGAKRRLTFLVTRREAPIPAPRLCWATPSRFGAQKDVGDEFKANLHLSPRSQGIELISGTARGLLI